MPLLHRDGADAELSAGLLLTKGLIDKVWLFVLTS